MVKVSSLFQLVLGFTGNDYEGKMRVVHIYTFFICSIMATVSCF